MIRVVVDTSVLIRYLIKPSASIRELIELRWLGHVITPDKDILALGALGGVRMVTPDQFLGIFEDVG
jgi:predicted nucleic acid-binding protein